MSNENIKDLRANIIKGLDLAYQKLLISKRKENGELIFSQDGQIVRVKATELK